MDFILREYHIYRCIIDDNLTWRQQIENTSIEMSKSISIVNNVCYVIDRKASYNLCYTLVLPAMVYVCEIWGTTYNSRLGRICLQKKTIRIVCNVVYRHHTKVVR